MADPLFLLDSNICIYLLKGTSDAARRRVEGRVPGELATSAVAFAEVLRGVSSPEEAAHAEIFFSLVVVLPFDRLAAEQYVKMPFKRGSYDRLIGAQALASDLVLVTANERHFADIPGLKIENWTI